MTEEPPPPRRLSERRGRRLPEEPYLGLPEHLKVPLTHWAVDFLGRRPHGETSDEHEANLRRLANLSRIKLSITEPNTLYQLIYLTEDLHLDPEADRFFDVIDMHLQVFGAGHAELTNLLRDGGSVWTVAQSPRRLEERVPSEQRELYVNATAEGDDAAEQLREAWGKVYGRDRDPSDAWDHAIKAVEFLLHRIVSPKNNRATLGSMSEDLLKKPEKWTLLLTTSHRELGEVKVLAGMLKLMWGNPDRHGSGTGYYRNPTPEEAEQIVGMAVLVVSWLRKNALQRDPSVQ